MTRWINEPDIEIIAGSEVAFLPDYIQQTLKLRCSKNGGGMLWSADETDKVVMSHWPDTEFAKTLLSKDYGGIIIRKEDLSHLCFRPRLPGIVTDLELNVISRLRTN